MLSSSRPIDTTAGAIIPTVRIGWLMLVSGLSSLGYQIIWTRQCAVWLGHEAIALLAVVAAFFGGLALGSHWAGPRVEASARPERWYAVCEMVIATWCLALVLSMDRAGPAVLDLIGAEPAGTRHWIVAFSATLMLLLPATFAMGATLPAAERMVASATRGRSLGRLYAINTLGAMTGVLACALWLIPAYGLNRTAALCALCNVACATLAMRLRGRALPPAPKDPAIVVHATPLIALAACGLLGIGYEVAVVRVLAQLVEDTAYTFALLLAVYLGASALGAALWARRGGLDTRPPPAGLTALACLAGTTALWGGASLAAIARQALGPGLVAALAVETMLALLAFAAPAMAMGALFCALAARAMGAGSSPGRCLAWNTAGAACAPPAFGLWLLPALGAKATLLLIATAYLAVAPAASRRALPAGVALAALALLAWAPPLRFVDIPPDGRLVRFLAGPSAAVSVVEDGRGVKRLRIDNHAQEGASNTRPADARQAWLPLLLHPDPRRALFLGLGTGVTTAAGAAMPGVKVEAVELLPEVVAAAREFVTLPESGDPDGPKVINADARRFVRTTGHRYDVIISDNFHPARSGSAALYTIEHFRAVRARLEADGLFCQWLPLHQMDLQTLRVIVQSFRGAFPGGWAILATNSLETPVLGLVGRRGDAPFDAALVQRRIDRVGATLALGDSGLVDAFAVLGAFVAGPNALATFAGDTDPNTDDHPRVAYLAPRATYAPEGPPRDRLLEFLTRVHRNTTEVLGPATEPEIARRLAAYWSARDAYLRLGAGIVPSGDARAMLARVRAPLVAILRTSADFRPAYDPLLRLALALEPSDPGQARELLAEIAPFRPRAQ